MLSKRTTVGVAAAGSRREEDGSRSKKIFANRYLLGGAAAAVVAGTITLGAPAAGANGALAGTWSRDLPCTSTSQSVQGDPVNHTSHLYASQVLAPINADGTSVWPAKRGVIPVQFKVTDTPVTTTSTTTSTTTTTSCKFESLASGFAASDHTAWSWLGFVPSGPLTVGDVTNLTANFTWTTGHNQGGGFRWVLGTPNGQIWVHYGDTSTSLQTGTAGSGVNMMGMPDARFEASQLGHSPMYDTWANVEPLYANLSVSYIGLVLDGGWASDGDQVIDVSSLTVNDNTKVDPLADEVSTSTSTETLAPVYGTPVATNQPPATLKLYRVASTGDLGAIDEVLTSAQGDSGGNFRQVDGKYIYNLNVAGLGTGAYRAFIVIGGTELSQPGLFGLK